MTLESIVTVDKGWTARKVALVLPKVLEVAEVA